MFSKQQIYRPMLFLLLSVGVQLSDAMAQTVGKNPNIPKDTTYTVESTYRKLLKDYPYIKPVSPVAPEGIVEKKDIVYLTIPETTFGDRNLHVDIFIPGQKEKVFPALVLIHGGGWRAGDKTLNTPMAQQLATRGFVVVSVEYRLSLEARYPAAVHDIKAAIRWMRSNAKKYQIDAERIAIGGSSAGGQLASLIGATNGNKKFEGLLGNQHFSSDVQAVIDMDGLLDFTSPENLAVKRNEKSADVFWLEGFYEQNTEKWKEASALNWVNKASPPFLFINSSQPRFHAGCTDMITRLNEFGIYSELHKLEGSPHSYWLFHPWFDPTIDYIHNFLTKVFKPT
jgi:acetyl esterase/lipase